VPVLANENVSGDIVQALRNFGHDVLWIRTDAPGSSDEVVPARAHTEDRLLLTFDKDFGELAFRFGLPISGVILLRLSASSPTRLTQIVMAALTSREDWAGMFSVVEEGRVRMTALPKPKQDGK
jgi:predicted nuclease of predicted toxin-antitoxin system